LEGRGWNRRLCLLPWRDESCRILIHCIGRLGLDSALPRGGSLLLLNGFEDLARPRLRCFRGRRDRSPGAAHHEADVRGHVGRRYELSGGVERIRGERSVELRWRGGHAFLLWFTSDSRRRRWRESDGFEEAIVDDAKDVPVELFDGNLEVERALVNLDRIAVPGIVEVAVLQAVQQPGEVALVVGQCGQSRSLGRATCAR
jgi:hypothetical protein